MASPISPHSATRHVSATTRGGFTYPTAYTLGPVPPLTGWASLLRHPIAYLLPDQVPRSPPPTRKQTADRVVSIPGFSMGAVLRAREYQPVIHRLRLSASP
jgi:hypothetical protein